MTLAACRGPSVRRWMIGQGVVSSPRSGSARHTARVVENRCWPGRGAAEGNESLGDEMDIVFDPVSKGCWCVLGSSAGGSPGISRCTQLWPIVYAGRVSVCARFAAMDGPLSTSH